MTITSMAERAEAAHAVSYLRSNSHWTCLAGLAFADVLVFTLANIIFRMGRAVPTIILAGGRPSFDGATSIDVFALIAVVFIVFRYLSGDYSRRQLFWDNTRQSTVALAIAALPDLFLTSLNFRVFAVANIVASWIFLIVAIPLGRQLARKLLAKAGVWYIPTALIGSSARITTIYNALARSLSLGFEVRWSVSDVCNDTAHDLPKVIRSGTMEPREIAEQLLRAECAQAVVATESNNSTEYTEVVRRLMEAGIAVAIVPSFQRLPLVGATTNYFFGHDVLLLQVRSNLRRFPQKLEKRVFDIVGALSLLILFSPLFLFIATAIKRHDGGRVTYSQKRVGQNGQTFRIIKFRTMAPDAEERLQKWRREQPELYEEYAKTFKLRDDPRITAPGKWLRKTSLDELPQLVNVLRGEMSLVGPRPVVEQELRDYYGSAAQLYVRVRPGLTGLWQVSGRSDTSYEERVIFDEWYVLNWSFWYDIVILIQTAGIMLTGRGAY